MPRFSILLPVFNGAGFIEEAIRSVLEQTFQDFELLIINDGSTDRTAKIIESVQGSEERIKYFYKRHSGLADALNLGISYSSGEIISRIDADDRWLPGKLSVQDRQLRENKDLSIIGSSVYFINAQGKRIAELSGFNLGQEIHADELKGRMLRNNMICSSSLVFYKSILDTIGNFNTRFEISMDYDFLIRALKQNKGMVSEKILVEYRISRNMMTLKERGKMIRESSKVRMNALKAFNATTKEKLLVCKDILGLYMGGITYKRTGRHPVSPYLD
jgi:glycosyltransferase involved in cell wall biosynthesis